MYSCIIDEMYFLIWDYGWKASKYGQNIHIQKFGYDYYSIGYECLYFYPLGCIFCSY